VSRLRRLELAVSAPWLLGRALRSYRRAERLGAPGLDFARFGRRTGINLLLRGDPGGPALLLTPVNIVRYWEFSFAWEALAGRGGRCLDVASPRLFSIRVASSRNGVHVRMINPDGQDACVTRRFARRLNLTQLAVEALPVEELDDRRYDLIWSISVLEHIAGDRGDTEAIRRLYGALAPGGRLIVIDTARQGLLGRFGSAPAADSGGTLSALHAAGFRPARLLAEREGHRFIEGLKPQS